ncbi:hypothetical protein ACHAXS_006522 [Conticribra weissflogii]
MDQFNSFNISRRRDDDRLIPLDKWDEIESALATKNDKNTAIQQNYHDFEGQKKISMLRRTTIVYGIFELVRHVVEEKSSILSRNNEILQNICSVDNFLVRIIHDVDENFDTSWEVTGVLMKCPHLGLRLNSLNSFSGDIFDEDSTGRNVEAEIDDLMSSEKCSQIRSESQNQNQKHGMEVEMRVCHLLGRLFYRIFSSNSNDNDIGIKLHGKGLSGADNYFPMEAQSANEEQDCLVSNISLYSKNDEGGCNKANLTRNSSNDKYLKKKTSQGSIIPLTELGCSSNVWTLVKNLIDCGLMDFRPDDSYPSLQVASDDIHLMLRDPGRFLFSNESILAAGQNDDTSFKVIPEIVKDKLYGRGNEISTITNAFCRVASSGESAALFIRGWSGCGKSSLVSNTFVPIRVAGGYIVSRKFDEVSTISPLSVVISALDELCVLVRERNSKEELSAIQEKLVRDFGTNLPKLFHALPNFRELFTAEAASCHLKQQQHISNGLNFEGLCFAMQCFMRVISSESRPVMIFLDDLQWADKPSLGLVHTVLSDIKKMNTLFFVGTYRSHEVQQDHVICRFINSLESFGVEITHITLEGMIEEDVNALISDSLSMFPRICRSLSSLLYHRTRGNPLFTIEFLESLVKHNLIQYSFRERRWVWDESKVKDEELSNNILHLLTTKMGELPPRRQEALKVASCFGSQISKLALEILSKSSKYTDLSTELDKAAREGFLELVGSRSSGEFTAIKFHHDKIREAAYGLINKDELDRYHHDIGMVLHLNAHGDDEEELIFSIVHHINCGFSVLLKCPSEEQISIAQLNLRAGKKAIQHSSFMSAHSYLKVGVELLPEDSWENQSKLSVDLYFLLSKAAYALGLIDDANTMLKTTIEKVKKLEDKLDVYFLYIKTLLFKREFHEAFETCRWILSELGENLPDAVGDDNIDATSLETYSMYSCLTNSNFLKMKQNKCQRQIAVMKFYNQLITVTYHAASRQMRQYYICKWAQSNLTNGCCTLTPNCLATFSCILTNWILDTKEGYRIGKIAVDMMNRFNVVAECAPLVYISVYAYVAILVEPIQACVDMMQKGYEQAMSNGDTYMAASNLAQKIPKSLFCGTRLQALNDEIRSQLTRNNGSLHTPYWLIYQDTVSLLIDEDAMSPTIEADLLDRQTAVPLDCLDCLSFLRLISSYWLGQYERAVYYAERKLGNERSKFRIIASEFYHGLALIGMFRRKRKIALMKRIKKSIFELHGAAEHSQWNFQNKEYLLMAEMTSISNQNKAAIIDWYDKAIDRAKRSKFIHEEGLACELAGCHYSSVGKGLIALRYFSQAKECYRLWGSRMKVKHMEKQIQKINATTADQ